MILLDSYPNENNSAVERSGSCEFGPIQGQHSACEYRHKDCRTNYDT